MFQSEIMITQAPRPFENVAVFAARSNAIPLYVAPTFPVSVIAIKGQRPIVAASVS